MDSSFLDQPVADSFFQEWRPPGTATEVVPPCRITRRLTLSVCPCGFCPDNWVYYYLTPSMTMPVCTDNGGPPMNTDISGVGVRLSFYLQTLFLGCLSARSTSFNEIRSALYTLVLTNAAMALTTLILGSQPDPAISFHDALVVIYLLFISGAAIFFSFPSPARFPGNTMLHLLTIAQTYASFAFTLVVLINARTFGDAPQCNSNAVCVLFRPLPALGSGRIVCGIFTTLAFLVYIATLVRDYTPDPMKYWIRKRATGTGRSMGAASPPLLPEIHVPSGPSRNIISDRQKPGTAEFANIWQERGPTIAWDVCLKLFIILVLWSVGVLNTELLIHWNRFAPPGAPSWQFGQVLPLFFVVLPLVDCMNVSRKLSYRPAPGNVKT